MYGLQQYSDNLKEKIEDEKVSSEKKKENDDVNRLFGKELKLKKKG